MTATLEIPTGISSGRDCECAVYIAALGAYNNGILHGHWIDLNELEDTKMLQACIDYILKTSPQPGEEEWAMHDHTGLPKFLTKSEWPDWKQVFEFLTIHYDLGQCEKEAYKIACDNVGQVLERTDFEDSLYGFYKSEEDFAEDYYEEHGHNLGALSSYIDWEMVWNGEFRCGSWWSAETNCGTAIFSS